MTSDPSAERDIRDGWCESCGKRVPSSFQTGTRAKPKDAARNNEVESDKIAMTRR